MITTPVTLTPYARRYRRDLLRLTQDHHRLHVHLDWTTLDEWLDEPNVALILAWQANTLIGALAAAPPLNNATWLRLVAVHDEADAGSVLADLWSPLRDQLTRQGVHEVGALLLRPWLVEYTAQFNLTYQENVVTLRRTGGHIPIPRRTDIMIRLGDMRDLDMALLVDHAAFGPLWQMSRESMRQAIRLSANFTLASLDNRVVGYQLSSLYHDGAHLARLATLPDVQGRGIGGALVGRMLDGYARRGINHVTVNTQQTNQASQHLYQRYGFDFTGPDMPVWATRLG